LCLNCDCNLKYREMIQLTSAISGFRAMLGPGTVQLAMLLTLLIFVERPPYSTDMTDPVVANWPL
jgi:hypothetical protein